MCVDELVDLDQLNAEAYGQVMCYPRCSVNEWKNRLEELRNLGMTAIEFSGKKVVAGLPVLGKGCVGIVIGAYRRSEKVAMKIRRVDADRTRMQQEAEMLKTANTVRVGPCLLDVSDNFLIMDFVEGMMLPEWLHDLERSGAKLKVKRVLQNVLEQSWRLDELGMDHGELSRAPKHIIVDADGKPWIVDFESASVNRKVSNVTSMCHYLFISRSIAEIMQSIIGQLDRAKLVQALKNYKQNRTRENFEKILKVCILRNS